MEESLVGAEPPRVPWWQPRPSWPGWSPGAGAGAGPGFVGVGAGDCVAGGVVVLGASWAPASPTAPTMPAAPATRGITMRRMLNVSLLPSDSSLHPAPPGW